MEENTEDILKIEKRLEEAMRMTAPGTNLRRALDMIIAGRLGALICIGDENHVLDAGNDGFPLNISFTANRLFELSKMDGAIVVDGEMKDILRANFHLNPDPSLPTSETGMRHRTAARMSLLTDALVISISERRQVINVYYKGHSFEIKQIPEIMALVNQLIITLQGNRQILDRNLLRLTTLELNNSVTLADISDVFSYFEELMSAAEELSHLIDQLGKEGRNVAMQRDQLLGNMDEDYTLMIRDYAKNSSKKEALKIRGELHELNISAVRSPKRVAGILGYEGLEEDSVMKPLGLRTLSNISVVREGVADKLVDEYGSLQELMDNIDNKEKLDDIGVKNPRILADSLHRASGQKN